MFRKSVIIFIALTSTLGGQPALFAAHNGSSSNDADGSKSHPPERTNGSYKVTFAGYLEGAGTATVNGQHLNIRGTVQGADGKDVEFHVKCDMVKDHFKGSGDAGGVSLDVEGRVDPADRTGRIVRGARVVATYETANGHHGRIVGERSDGQGSVHARS